jgi:uncharacterized phage-like protein YoqJ
MYFVEGWLFMIKVLTVTGYKSHELGIFKNNHQGVIFIKKALRQRLIPLVEEGLEWVIISGQLGVELWSAEVIFELQEEYPEIKLGILTPFLEQESRWKDETKEYYENILLQADFVDAITKRPYDNPGQLKLKNQYLIEKSDGLLVLYDDGKLGSPKFYLDEAIKKKERNANYQIYTINFEDINFLIQDEASEY